MRKENPLKPFHSGLPIKEIEPVIPWHATRDDLAALIPDSIITSQNQHWVSLKCTILNVQDEFGFSFIPHPDPLFREVQVYDDDPNSMMERFSLFTRAIKDLLGPSTMEFEKSIRWHDKLLVLDLSISDGRDTPEGPTFPRFMLSFQNTMRYASHWNNRGFRRLGLE